MYLKDLTLFTDAEIKGEYNRRFKKPKAQEPLTGARLSCSTLYTGPQPKNAAAAAKIRRERMTNCGCTLCHAALNPCLTFEAQAIRMGRPYPEHNAPDSEGFSGDRWHWVEGKNPNRPTRPDDIFPIAESRFTKGDE